MLLGVGKTAAALLLGVDVLKRAQRSVPTWTVGINAAETAKVVREHFGDAGFWPTPLLGGYLSGQLQTIWYGLHPFSRDAEFSEDRWQAPDGGLLGLAWPDVSGSSLPGTAPVCLVLPGLCGSIKGTGHTMRALEAAGLRPVCLHARGCGVPLTTPCFNLFGCTDDVRDAIRRIQAQYPAAPLLLYSISAGTGLMVRYLGEEGDDTPVIAGVANCPGYDISVCMQRVGWLYDAGFYIGVLKKHWLTGANGELLREAQPELCARMETAPTMHDFMVAAAPFAEPAGALTRGAAPDAGTVANGFAQFLARSNPMGVAHKISIPALIVNADDDPVCASANLDDNIPALLGVAASCEKTVLLRYPRGGHCCFARGMRAHRFSDELAAGFLAAWAKTTSTSEPVELSSGSESVR